MHAPTSFQNVSPVGVAHFLPLTSRPDKSGFGLREPLLTRPSIQGSVARETRASDPPANINPLTDECLFFIRKARNVGRAQCPADHVAQFIRTIGEKSTPKLPTDAQAGDQIFITLLVVLL